MSGAIYEEEFKHILQFLAGKITRHECTAGRRVHDARTEWRYGEHVIHCLHARLSADKARAHHSVRGEFEVRLGGASESVRTKIGEDGACGNVSESVGAAAGVPTSVMVAPVIPAINDADIERILDAASIAGVKGAGYVMLRLPLEVRDLFVEWLRANYPDREKHVMKLVREMRGGKDYDSTYGQRMTGAGPYAWMIGRRFENACAKLGLNTAQAAAQHRTFPFAASAGRAAQPVRLRAMSTHDGNSVTGSSSWADIDRRDARRRRRAARARGSTRRWASSARFARPATRSRSTEAGGVVLALWDWNKLADDAALRPEPRRRHFAARRWPGTARRPRRSTKCSRTPLTVGGRLLRKPEKTEYGGYRGYFADPDGHPWEVVQAPGFTLTADGRLADLADDCASPSPRGRNEPGFSPPFPDNQRPHLT